MVSEQLSDLSQLRSRAMQPVTKRLTSSRRSGLCQVCTRCVLRAVPVLWRSKKPFRRGLSHPGNCQLQPSPCWSVQDGDRGQVIICPLSTGPEICAGWGLGKVSVAWLGHTLAILGHGSWFTELWQGKHVKNPEGLINRFCCGYKKLLHSIDSPERRGSNQAGRTATRPTPGNTGWLTSCGWLRAFLQFPGENGWTPRRLLFRLNILSVVLSRL